MRGIVISLDLAQGACEVSATPLSHGISAIVDQQFGQGFVR
jgi:hypothetical protein